MKNLVLRQIVFLAILGILTNCSKDDELTGSDLKEILDFTLPGQVSRLILTGGINEVAVSVSNGTDITSIAPNIQVSPNATVSPASGVSQDFTSPVTYTVIAENGTKQKYTVTVTVEGRDDCEIKNIKLSDGDWTTYPEIDYENNIIEAIVPGHVDITQFVPEIEIPIGATLDGITGEAVNLTTPIQYTVTSADKSQTCTYTLKVTQAKDKILEFKFEEFSPVISGVIDQDNQTITVEIPWYKEFDIYDMTPTITIEEGATLDLASGKPNSFLYPQDYWVEPEVGEWKKYTVTVNVEAAPTVKFDELTVKEYERGAEVTVTGEGFSHVSNLEIRGQYSEYADIKKVTQNSFSFIIPESAEPGEYELLGMVRDSAYVMASFTVLTPAPEISSLSTYEQDGNNIVYIGGQYFLSGDNEVYFVQNGTTYKSENFLYEDNYSIEAIVPHDIRSGTYTVKVVVNNKSTTSTEAVSLSPNSNPLLISSVNSMTVKKGATLTISGKGFNSKLPYTVQFLGSKNIYIEAKTISSTTLQVTIPTDSETGKYDLYIYTHNEELDVQDSNGFYNISIE